jgi:type II secretory pathway pseudopilin PulG
MIHRRRPGFTLVETIVAMVISIIILGTAMTIMVNTLVQGKRGRAQAEMARDGALAAQLMSQELRQAGLGVPNRGHINAAYGATANETFYASLLVAGGSQIGIVGDLSRPDANYNAYGPLHSRDLSTTGTHVAWHTENNGGCVVDGAAGTSCSTAVTSLFFPGEAGCAAVGTGDFGDRSCPWGVRRVLPGERIIIVSGDGRWAHAALATPGTIDKVGPSDVFAARLSPGYSPTDWPDPPPPSLPVTAPNQTGGQGWVATLDRVFFKYDAPTRTIQRIQCTGDPDPDNANWPGPTATAIPASLTFTPTGGDANVCGPFEIIARHVESLTFTYFDGAGLAVPVRNTGALKRSVRRVAYRIQFRQQIDARDVTYDVSGSVRLQNL